MARYTVTLVFAVAPASNRDGSDPLAGVPLPAHATACRSSCEGSTMTVVADIRSSRPAAVCRQLADAVRARWAEVSGADPGQPMSVRLTPLHPPMPVGDAEGRSREYAWCPDGDGDGGLVLVDAGSGATGAPDHTEPPEHGGSTLAGPSRRPVRRFGAFRLALPRLPRRDHG